MVDRSANVHTPSAKVCRPPHIVTFSGIDGAGKTTQIETTAAHLSQMGYRVARVAFWDDVAVLPQLRTRVSSQVFKKKPASSASLRHDKNVRTWYLTLVRSFFYALDTIRLRQVAIRLFKSEDFDFIIFDRYVYDLLVQVRSRNWWARTYRKALLALAPLPYKAFILDASPDDAFKRKPEYPLAFMHEYRREFLGLSEFVPHMEVIAPATIDEVHQQIMTRLLLASAADVCLRTSPDTVSR
jgi:thymidylate kinase